MELILRNSATGTFKFFTITSTDEIPDILSYYKTTMQQEHIPLDTPIYCDLAWAHDFSKENNNDTNTNT